jgi:glutamate N-acetyltransferase/amino-acid N-acetyltransferase
MTRSRSITIARGFKAAGGTCGIKESGKPDLMLIVSAVPCAAAGVFTTNRVVGAPVIVNKRHLRTTAGVARAIVCNSGISNSATGEPGIRDAEAMCQAVANRIGCPRAEVMASSTGIIGRPLPMPKILHGIAALHARLDRGPKADAAAAGAIVTTDLVTKSASRRFAMSGRTIHLGGIAKGSGMIAPNMATMLVFITTDCAIAPGPLRAALRVAALGSFNRISIDEHTSLSDTVLVLASGLAANRAVHTTTGRGYTAFVDALTDLCGDLAYQIVKDGEGATKVFRVRVRGARSVSDADKIGRADRQQPAGEDGRAWWRSQLGPHHHRRRLFGRVDQSGAPEPVDRRRHRVQRRPARPGGHEPTLGGHHAGERDHVHARRRSGGRQRRVARLRPLP